MTTKSEKPKASDYRESFQESIDKLKNEIEETQDELDFNPSDFFPKDNDIDLNLKIEMHDYEKDLEVIREESKETLECLANLYLDEDIMNNIAEFRA